jgi:outer membrane protein insertion porin family
MWIVCIVFLAVLAGKAPAQQAGLIAVESIRFEGLSSWDEAQLKGRLSTKEGQPYNPLLVREDLTQLARVMRRADVRTESVGDHNVAVIFKVEEFPRLRNIQIMGNETLPTSRIENLVGVKPGEVLDDNVVGSLRRSVTEEHRQRGLAEATVEVKVAWVETAEAEGNAPGFGGAPAGREADLQIIVNEGRRIMVDDLVIEGNEAFSTVRLKLHIETKGSWLFFRNYYNDSIFEEDLVALRQFYGSNGYFDAIVERGEFRHRTRGDREVITPVIRIQEGGKYRLGEVSVRGAYLFSVPEILEPFEPLQGKDFDGKKFSKAMAGVRDLYSARVC